MSCYPSGLRERSAKPLFMGSNPMQDSNCAWVIQSAEITDLNPVKCGFESHPTYQIWAGSLIGKASSLQEERWSSNLPSSTKQ
jgi:hypothetical protein